jgi:peptidoglycan-associated lipoprotein
MGLLTEDIDMNSAGNSAFQSVWCFAIGAAAALLSGSCGPDYPKCDNDDDCKKAEFCVNNQCQKCRRDDDCAQGQRCGRGACQAIPDYCTTSDDCGPGEDCLDNTCVTPRVQSTEEDDTTANCTLEPIYFEFDSSNLDTASRDKLSQAAACIKQRASSVQLTGMTDPRGTEEYNLALGDRRAQAAKKYLESLGVPSRLSATSMGEEMATGTDENGYMRDRRVDLK